MRKTLMTMLLFITLFVLYGCREQPIEEREKPLVITTLFPHYDMVKHLAGDLVDVEFLLPTGTDAHSFEPSSKTMVRLKTVDLFIYTGIEIEPWAHSLINETIFSLDLSTNIPLIEDDDDDHHSWLQELWYGFLGWFGYQYDDAHPDPHYWLDPHYAKIMVNEIADALIILLPDDKDIINVNRTQYLNDLDDLDAAYLDLIEYAEINTIMHGGHNAFSYFARRYEIDYHTPYRGFSNDAEPTPQALAEMITLMNELEIEHLFSEVLISPHVAQAITENTNASILYIYAAENIPIDDYEKGVTFLDMMYHNLEQFKIGLRYQNND